MGCLRADGAEPKPCAAIVRRRKQAIHLLLKRRTRTRGHCAAISILFVMVGSGAAAASGTPTRRARILLKPLPVARHIATASVRGIGREVPWCPTRHVRRTACFTHPASPSVIAVQRAHRAWAGVMHS